jgi:hypothetical protein
MILFAVLAFFCGCEAMDTFLPSSGTYKVNARVDNFPLDEFSFISSGDKIWPFFENSVSGDPDVTALTLFLRDFRGEVAGSRVVYNLDNSVDEENESSGEELSISVKSLDDNLPYYPVPPDLPMGQYKLIFQIMRGNQILQRSEKSFFYLADVNFSFDSIQVHQGGVSASSQQIPKGTVIMLEAKLDFDSGLDPYIVWYNGKSIISEGSFSNGAGNLLWKAPEQSGFISIRAEAFPIKDRQGLAGYSKDISLLVSSKKADIHLLSEDNQDILYWYVFEGDLRDTKSNGLPELALKPAENISPKWIPASGTFGLAAGTNDIYTLPGVSFSNNESEFWQILSRFKPLDDGGIFSIQFGSQSAVTMNLIKDNKNLILMLISSTEVVTQTLNLPETDSFLTVEVNFSVQPNRLIAKFDIPENSDDQGESESEAMAVNAQLNNEFLVMLGSQYKNDITAFSPGNKPALTVILDEFALLHLPDDVNMFADEIMEEPPAKDESSEEMSLGEKGRQESDASGSLT